MRWPTINNDIFYYMGGFGMGECDNSPIVRLTHTPDLGYHGRLIARE